MRFKKLKEIFDEKWIKANPEHPIAIELSSTSPFFHGSLFNLEKNLSALEGVERIGRIIRRLKNRQEYFGALLEIEMASELLERGFEIQLQPRLANGKSADIYVKSKNLFVETKTLGQSNVERRLFEIMHHIATIQFKNLKIRIELTPELTKLLELINLFPLSVQEMLLSTIKEAFADGLRRRIKDLLFVEAGIDTLVSISVESSKGAVLEIFGCGMPKDEFNRLARLCITKAALQLPEDAAGIIALKTYHRIGKELIRGLQKILSKHNHVASLILFQGHFSNGFHYKKYVVRNPHSKFFFAF